MHSHFSFLVTMADERKKLFQYDEEVDSAAALPEGWIAVNEVNEDGVVEYFTNVITGQAFYTRDDLMHYVAYARQANLPQPPVFDYQPVAPEPVVRCARCRNTGHNAPDCQFSEAYIRAISSIFEPPPFKRGQSNQRTVYQCSRCGRYGHNVRTCHGPIIS